MTMNATIVGDLNWAMPWAYVRHKVQDFAQYWTQTMPRVETEICLDVMIHHAWLDFTGTGDYHWVARLFLKGRHNGVENQISRQMWQKAWRLDFRPEPVGKRLYGEELIQEFVARRTLSAFHQENITNERNRAIANPEFGQFGRGAMAVSEATATDVEIRGSINAPARPVHGNATGGFFGAISQGTTVTLNPAAAERIHAQYNRAYAEQRRAIAEQQQIATNVLALRERLDANNIPRNINATPGPEGRYIRLSSDPPADAFPREIRNVTAAEWSRFFPNGPRTD